MCAPGITLDELLEDSIPIAGPIIDHTLERLRALDGGDELIVDPIPGKLMLKRDAMFCLVEPKRKWVAIGFQLERKLDSERLSRKVMSGGRKHYHVVNVGDVDELDEELLGWIEEAFVGPPPDDVSVGGADPMVPDDVDIFPDP